MTRSSRQSLWSRARSSKLTLAIGIILVLFAFVSFGRELYNRIQVNQEISRLEQQVRELESRKTRLTNLIEYFESPLFQEQEAREKLGLAKPGESVVVVPTTNTSPTASASGTDETTGSEIANPKKWWQYFFDQQPQQEKESS